jgi:hypothetical protein
LTSHPNSDLRDIAQTPTVSRMIIFSARAGLCSDVLDSTKVNYIFDSVSLEKVLGEVVPVVCAKIPLR